MKFNIAFFVFHVLKSLPTRGRGLKLKIRAPIQTYLPVAPHAGAWIEIQQSAFEQPPHLSPPHAGAWIEIA